MSYPSAAPSLSAEAFGNSADGEDPSPVELPAGEQLLRRRLGRVLLRLRQSRKGLATAANLTKTKPAVSERLSDMSLRRHEREATFANTAIDSALGWRAQRDFAGTTHRFWLRVVGGSGSAVFDECDRGEASLERAVRLLIKAGPPDSVRQHALSLRKEIQADLDWMKSHRRSSVPPPPALLFEASRRAGLTKPEPAGVGSAMPAFQAPASTGQTLDSERFRGKIPLVIFFVPDARSRRSTRLIVEFNRNLGRFGRLRTQVLGVVPETAKRLREQAELRGYNLPLLADPDEAIHRAFGITDVATPHWSTFIVDRSGTIAQTFRPTVRLGRANQVLAAIKALKRDERAPMDPRPGSTLHGRFGRRHPA